MKPIYTKQQLARLREILLEAGADPATVGDRGGDCVEAATQRADGCMVCLLDESRTEHKDRAERLFKVVKALEGLTEADWISLWVNGFRNPHGSLAEAILK